MMKKSTAVNIFLTILLCFAFITALQNKQEANKQKALADQWQKAAEPTVKDQNTPTPERLDHFLRQLKRAKEIAKSTWKIESVNNVYFSISSVSEKNKELLFPLGITKPHYKELEKDGYVGFKFFPDVIESFEPTEFLIPTKVTSLHPSKVD